MDNHTTLPHTQQAFAEGAPLPREFDMRKLVEVG
jgi:hypothetical protein